MADGSAIEWTEASWNPVVGCTAVSTGCDHCYAAREASGRLAHLPLYAGLAVAGVFTGEVRLVDERVELPLRWRRPRRIFTNSMSDLFHNLVPVGFVARVFAVMALAGRHQFQVLTKRPARARSLLTWSGFRELVAEHATELIGSRGWQRWQLDLGGQRLAGDSGLGAGWEVRPGTGGNLWVPPWPLPNVWLGVSVENQHWADIRVPALLGTPAAVRWLSCEPLLGPLRLREQWLRPDLFHQDTPSICWVVAGGESGPQARPMHPDWPRALRDQCQQADVAFFFKQHGEWMPVGPLYDQDGDGDQVAEDARFDAVTLEVEDRREVIELETSGYMVRGHQPGDPRTWLMARTGKKTAGRELDGRVFDEYPVAVA